MSPGPGPGPGPETPTPLGLDGITNLKLPVVLSDMGGYRSESSHVTGANGPGPSLATTKRLTSWRKATRFFISSLYSVSCIELVPLKHMLELK